jgi:predicted metalloendopeptidase
MIKQALRPIVLGLLSFSLIAAAPSILPWGVDLASMDRSVKPGDDFFHFSGGLWMRSTSIPPDRTSWSTFTILRAKAEADVRAIVERIAHRPQRAGSIGRKIADTYNSYSDVAAIEANGLGPIHRDLAEIAAARSYDDVARLMGRPELAVGGPISITAWPDAGNPDRYALNVVQSGLTLPNRDYYLSDDARRSVIRAQFRTYVAAMLDLVQYPDHEASAEAVLRLETEIAKAQWTNERRSDRSLTYHPKSRAQLRAYAPDYPWDVTLAALGVPRQDLFVVKEDGAIRELSRQFRATPIATWRAYMTFHYLAGMADVLPKAFDELTFNFNGRTLSGQQQQRARSLRAIDAVNAALGEGVGQLYVQQHFAPQARAQITAMVENMRAAYRARIAGLDWMSPRTRNAALAKLAAMRVKVGYPNRWRDYSTLVIRAGDAVGNRKRSRLWEWRRRAERLDQQTDRDEWGMTPQTVNAYSNSFFNEIVFPAAILQPPYFDPNADPAVNYGGIGAVIGHEMSHAFDDQGAKTDARGAQRNWWDNADLARFGELTARLAKQYSAYEALPGAHVNGQTTLSENIGDLAGVSIAFDAYRRSLHGKNAPILNGFTGDQRFFLAYGQSYRENIRDQALRANLASDPHSPAVFRVNGILRNIDAWYDAFGVVERSRLYLPPEERVRIW